MTAAAHPPAAPPSPALAVFERWLHMWNHDPQTALQIIAPTLTTHLPAVGMPAPGAVHDPATMAGWVAAFRSSYAPGRFTPVIGPVAVGELVLCHWRFEGTWRGGRPATATAPPGTAVDFRGVDVVRLEGGLVREYWLVDNQLDLYAQLGAHVGG